MVDIDPEEEATKKPPRNVWKDAHAGALKDPKPKFEEAYKPIHMGLYGKLPKSYWYYDTPDGMDCIPKMWFCIKTGALLGGIASIYDVLMFTKPVGYNNVAFRIAHGWLYASMATGAVYTAAVCTALDLRKKDDKFNHLIGGIAAGCTWGAIRSCVWQTILFSGTLSLVGMYLKDCDEHNVKPLPDGAGKEWGFWLTYPEFDFSRTKEMTFDDRASDQSYRNTKWGFVPVGTGAT